MKIEQVDIATPENVSLKFGVAGLGSRSTAILIDLMIQSVVIFAISFTLIFLGDLFNEYFYVEGIFLAAVLIIDFLLFWGYFIIFEVFFAGRSPGKMIVGLRVIQENGQSVTFLSSLLRNLLRIIDFLPFFYLVGITTIFFHSKHKRVGDIVAGTIVIYESKTENKKDKRLIKEIEKRGINTNRITLNEWTKKKIGIKEWTLLKTYIDRRLSLSKQDYENLTIKVAGILFNILEIETKNKSIREIEDDLIALYILINEDWNYKTNDYLTSNK